MIKLSYIRKLPNGKWRVFSEKGKNMGTFDSQSAAKNRLRQIEFFKHKASSNNDLISLADDKINLSREDMSYSSIIRKLRHSGNEKLLSDFMSFYKNIFDQAYLEGKNNPDKVALIEAVIHFVKSKDIFVKTAGSKDNIKSVLPITFEAKNELAKTSNDPGILKELFSLHHNSNFHNYQFTEIMNSLASNFNTPTEVLNKIYKLVRDTEEREAKFYLARNPNSSKEVAESLFLEGYSFELQDSWYFCPICIKFKSHEFLYSRLHMDLEGLKIHLSEDMEKFHNWDKHQNVVNAVNKIMKSAKYKSIIHKISKYVKNFV